jgi:GTP-binding protein
LKLIADVGTCWFSKRWEIELIGSHESSDTTYRTVPVYNNKSLAGYIEYKDGFRVCVADVPGLIAGAPEGGGKGIDFLRHLERAKRCCCIL